MFQIDGRLFPEALSGKSSEPEILTRHYGDPALAPPASLTLHAGLLSVVYTAGGDLRYIKYGKQEILRRIYTAVRAGDWWTVPSTLTEREWEIGGDTFRIVYEARYIAEDRGIDFRATVTITGDATGKIVYDFDGEPLSEFERKRIGICVLHPASIKGAACAVTHTDGSMEAGAFPDLIAPHQPFFDIRGVSHAVAPGVTANVGFVGDVFEMEDQRNWLDASFKTYSTPLALPSPVLVKPGERIRQTVTLTVDITPDAEPPIEEVETVTVTVGKPLPSFPSIGLRWTAETPALSKNLVDCLRSHLPKGHLWVDLDLIRPRWQYVLRRADDAAQKAGLSLYVLLRNTEAYLERYTWKNEAILKDSAILPTPQSPARWFVAGVPDANKLHLLKQIIPGASLGVGVLSNFTELNRSRPDIGALDSLFFAGNPQVHAFDSFSIMETPPMIEEAVRTARSFAGDKRIHLGPMTVYGPYQKEEPRQYSEMGAAWYMAVLSYALKAGVESITLCDVLGKNGLSLEDYEKRHRLREVLAHFNDLVITSCCPFNTDSESIAGFVVQGQAIDREGNNKNRSIMVLANLAPSKIDVRVQTPNGRMRTSYDCVRDTIHNDMGGMILSDHIEDGLFEDTLTPHSVTVYSLWEQEK